MPSSGHSKHAVSRAEFLRLKAECESVKAQLQELREIARQQSADLKVQFTRIAEIQAILDEERIANNRPREPRRLLPASH